MEAIFLAPSSYSGRGETHISYTHSRGLPPNDFPGGTVLQLSHLRAPLPSYNMEDPKELLLMWVISIEMSVLEIKMEKF